MTLPEHEHPWLIAMRRQRRWVYVTIAMNVLMALGLLYFTFALRKSLPSIGKLSLITVGAFAMFAIPIAIMAYQAKKQRRWTEQMLQCHGLLCPKCAVPLHVAENERSVQCEKCRRTYQAEELRQFWENLVTDPMKAGTWWVRNYGAGWRAFMVRWLWRDGRPRPVPLVCMNLVVWLTAGLFIGISSGQSLLVGAFTYSHMFFVMSGFILFTTGHKMRVGDNKYCAKCGYERGPEVNTPLRCPECGFDWNTFAGTVSGRSQPNKRLMAIGAGIAMLGFVLMFTPFMGGLGFRWLPTGPLIQQAVHKSGFTMAEWAELRTRTLTPEQIRTLATGLLKKRLDYPWLSNDEGSWLVAQIVAGRLPADLTQRYYSEMMEIELVVPDHAKVGSPISLQLRFTNRGSSTAHPAAEALIGGYYIDDDPEPIGRKNNAIAGVMLDVTVRGGSNLSNEATITPDRRGKVRVRARVWVIVVPRGTGSQPIQWQSEGTPVIPANAVWSELREMEKTIAVDR